MIETLLTGAPGTDPAALRPGDGARARLGALLDRDSFVELGSQRRHQSHAFGLDRKRPEGDGVVAGVGLVDERPVAVYAQDGKVLGGSLGPAHADKITRSIEQAARMIEGTARSMGIEVEG